MSRFNQKAAPSVRAVAASRPAPATPLSAPVPIRAPWVASETGRLPFPQLIGFSFVLVYVFARFSLISEIATSGFGFKPYIIIVFGPLAVLAALFCGEWSRFLLSRPARFVLAFMGWLTLAIPFATWRGGAFFTVKDAFMTDFVMFFMVAGLTLTWRQCVILMYAIATGGAIDFLASRFFGAEIYGRVSMSFGTLMNPNDFATHLLFALPFCVFMFMNSSRFSPLKPLAAGFGIAMLYTIAQTGSRGALIAVIGVLAVAFLKGSLRQRLVLAITASVTLTASVAVLPQGVWLRYADLFGGDTPVTTATDMYDYQIAVGSQLARQQLLIDSLRLTFTHPLFGVGPGDFASADAEVKASVGQRAGWQVTHNSYTEVSSEAGIPAFVLFLGILISSYRLISSVYTRTRYVPELRHLAAAAFALMLTMVGFCASILFASMAYKYYIPTLVGLTVALHRAAESEMQRFQAKQRTTSSTVVAPPARSAPAPA